MTPLPHDEALLAVARRVVWFKDPHDALRDPLHFLAHVMTYGTVEDLRVIQEIVTANDLLAVLEHAPPGVFDKRSWAYWNLKCGRVPTPAMPERRLP